MIGWSPRRGQGKVLCSVDSRMSVYLHVLKCGISWIDWLIFRLLSLLYGTYAACARALTCNWQVLDAWDNMWEKINKKIVYFCIHTTLLNILAINLVLSTKEVIQFIFISPHQTWLHNIPKHQNNCTIFTKSKKSLVRNQIHAPTVMKQYTVSMRCVVCYADICTIERWKHLAYSYAFWSTS